MSAANENSGEEQSGAEPAAGSEIVARLSGDEIAAWESHDGDVDPVDGDALIVDVDGFEGPLDLLLAMARTQKVDLARISVLQLAYHCRRSASFPSLATSSCVFPALFIWNVLKI